MQSLLHSKIRHGSAVAVTVVVERVDDVAVTDVTVALVAVAVVAVAVDDVRVGVVEVSVTVVRVAVVEVTVDEVTVVSVGVVSVCVEEVTVVVVVSQLSGHTSSKSDWSTGSYRTLPTTTWRVHRHSCVSILARASKVRKLMVALTELGTTSPRRRLTSITSPGRRKLYIMS